MRGDIMLTVTLFLEVEKIKPFFVGELGDGTTNTQYTPELLSSVSNVIQIAAGYFHSLAVLRTDLSYFKSLLISAF